jgi:sacsin
VSDKEKSFIKLTTVHVNGCFAVASNRRGLWQSTGFQETKTGASNRSHWQSAGFKDTKTEWNQELIKDAVSSAYLIMLEDLVPML